MRKLSRHLHKSIKRDSRTKIAATGTGVDNRSSFWSGPSSTANAPSTFLPSRSFSSHVVQQLDNSSVSKRQKTIDENVANNSNAFVRPQSPQHQPVLLLEGNQYHLSKLGSIARSFYYLVQYEANNSVKDDTQSKCGRSIAIEEHYDINNCRKSYILRETDCVHPGNGKINLGLPIMMMNDIILQEIPETLNHTSMTTSEGGPGTGSRTWDSSIAMAAFFGKYPELLKGHCIEVGSGVGLGATLSYLLSTSSSFSSGEDGCLSLTLTDYNDQVLHQCMENIKRICGVNVSHRIRATKLNWHDFLDDQENTSKHAGLYDTILACDCAYLYPDICALTTTLKKLMSQNEGSRCYIFGPRNRGGYHELMRQLSQDSSYRVDVEEVGLECYRLDASIGSNNSEETQTNHDFLKMSDYLGRKQKQSKFISSTTSAVLLATVSRTSYTLNADQNSISDID